jgi:hypothetical protein
MRILTKLSLLAPAVVLAGCQGNELAAPSPVLAGDVSVLSSLVPLTPDNATPALEKFKVCKYGSAASFSYSVDVRGTSTSPDETGTFSLNDGDCVLLAVRGGGGTDVTVSETGAQSGYHFDRVVNTTISALGCVNASTSQVVSSNATATGFISGAGLDNTCRGGVAEYYNVRDTGGQGCTPGYWKQSQHFDSWPAGVLPTDLFSSIFEDAFPGMTLLQVLEQGGGGLIALGRHTVAAYLNGGSSGVSYGMTSAQVVSAFNAAFPGTKTQYNTLKDLFATANEAGCPLN